MPKWYYEKARLDFAARSGLVAEARLFSAEQLTEIYHGTMTPEELIPEDPAEQHQQE